MPAALIVQDLVKQYGQTRAVDGVNFQVEGGEIFGLLGPNGAGKTSVIECVLGLRIQDRGTITVGGLDSKSHSEQIKQIVGAQLQATALHDKITPRQAMQFFGSFYQNAVPPDQLLQRFGLAGKADVAFDTLSTGQKQRLALALAFVNDPRILFLDEPTAGLDPRSRRELHADIRRLQDEGRAVILSTHYIVEAQELCDRVAIIDEGKIIGTGTPDALIANAGLGQTIRIKTANKLDEAAIRTVNEISSARQVGEYWELGTSQMNKCLIAVARLIDERDDQLIDLQIRRPSLEDVFLSLTGKSILTN